ncbi:MAG: class I tRNA ligase family protein [Bryobacterales bacterium]|nr:class I tRNA ligase family protein [Bryobacterales bacterium]
MHKPRFQRAKPIVDFPATEHEVGRFWEEHRIFDKSLSLREGAERFIFNEGPPTANGLPHNGHVLTRVFKDVFLRYRTMAGRYVPRKAGWDTHGLPVEVEVEKELGIHGKQAIEDYGVERFIRKCMDSVFRYTEEWEKMTRRVGFWVDLSDAYVTYHKSYVESVWWALAQLFRQGLLYRGHKIVWWWPQGGTALSAGEVGLGYRSVEDPSVYVACPLAGDPDVALLVWTTTPWTLPANQYVAVRPDFDYVQVRAGGRSLILAAALRGTIAKKIGERLPVEKEIPGSALLGQRYLPPFHHFRDEFWDSDGELRTGGREPYLWKVLAADFVTLDTGTGLVHQAPAFGEVDYDLHRQVADLYRELAEVPLLCPVRPDGTFDDAVTEVAGEWVKDADRKLIWMLRESGALVHRENHRHDYPFCWRADNDPLIQYARPAWFVRTTARNREVLANNDAINWLPEHIGPGRFGDFLRNNIDWALSRERYWGTPLNVWINDATGNLAMPSSCGEILQKNPSAFDHFRRAKEADASLSDHLMVHKPWIDEVTWTEPGEPGVYRRVPEVIDCWFDSGCMPFAQYGYPHQGRDEFESRFPADYITEAIDQTRGWFYSQLMVSTLVFDAACARELGIPAPPYPHPFRNCIVLGHVADPTGKKESKSLGNYTPPEVIFDLVSQDFAVRSGPDGAGSVQPGEAAMARQDLQALDLQPGDRLKVSVPGNGDRALRLSVRPDRRLPRRTVLLSERDMEAVGALPARGGAEVSPIDVPRLPAGERVSLEVPSPAPGADAFRWFFLAGNPPWSPTRHSLANVRTIQKEFPLKFRNVYSFFTIYADIDDFDPSTTPGRPFSARGLLDRWILSELDLLAGRVRASMDAFLAYEAAGELTRFVEGLSNWYLRRSRGRFWKSEIDADKTDAYATLYECLVSVAKLSASFTPFMAEEIYQNVVRGAGMPGPESVHLCDLPRSNGREDTSLSEEMEAVRRIVSLGLRVRTEHQLKVRQPLSRAEVVIADPALRERVAPYAGLIADELNVREVRFVEGDQAHVNYSVKPNFRRLGPRLGKKMRKVKKVFAELDAAALRASLLDSGSAEIDFDGERLRLDSDDVQVSVGAEEHFAAAGDSATVVVLSTELNDELRDEGFYRELLHRVQNLRKEADIEYTRRIELSLAGSERAARIVGRNRDHLMAETLCTKLRAGEGSGIERAFEIDGERIRIFLETV